MIKIIFLFLMVFTIYQNTKVLAANEMVTVDQVITFLDKYQTDIDKVVKKLSSNKKLEKQKKLQYFFKRIFAKNSDIWQGVAYNDLLFTQRQSDFFSYLKNTFPDFQMDKTTKIMHEIYRIHHGFQEYRNFDEKKDTEKSIKTYVTKNIDSVIPKKLDSLYAYILKSRSGPNLLDSIIEEIDDTDEEDRCDEDGSAQDKFYNFYLSCLSIELLAMTSMIDSYGVRELIKPSGGNKKKLNGVIAESKERMTQYLIEFTSSLAEISIKYRNCDPYGDEKHERGVSFLEMAGMIQYILMFSNYLGSKSCATCENIYLFNGTDNKDCHIRLDESTPWDENGAPKKFSSCTTPRNCYGKLHSCVTMWKPQYCMLKNNARRYKWVRDAYYSDDEHTFGDYNSGCSDGHYAENEYGTDSYRGFYCTYCWCVCDDTFYKSKIAVNTISLLPAMSLIAKNKVVTSVKMIIKDYILNIQVSEGTIGPNYIVDSQSNDWVRLPEMYNDVKESLANGGRGKLKQDTDYVLWSYEKNAINMDEIVLDYGRCITGVKFGIKKEEGKHDRIQLQVHSTKYDWKSGKLLQDTGKWHYPDGEHSNEGNFGRLNPTMTNKPTVIDSKTDGYYIFRLSDPRTDAGQTTLPLLEAYDIGAETPAAMSGIGLHHRTSNPDDGGFLGLHAYSIDYSKYMSELSSGKRTLLEIKK